MSTASLLTPASAPARPQLPPLPALVVGQVTHRRPAPVRHAFRHQVYQWLVDLDCLPRQPWHLRAFAHFSSADHLGDPRLPIKRNIENYLALGGIGLGDRGRVLMLASARVLRHMFDPLSVFDRDAAAPRCRGVQRGLPGPPGPATARPWPAGSSASRSCPSGSRP